jgi:26S proteasome regulatory subunit N10
LSSHLVVVPAGSSVVNTLASSPILFSSAGFGAMGGGGGGGDGDFDIYGGIDPNLDPELAMAIRVSQEEARAQEEARLRAAQEQVRSILFAFIRNNIYFSFAVSICCTCNNGSTT